MYKSVQMKLKSKEHICLTWYVSGKDVMPFSIKMIWFDFNGTLCSHILKVLFDYITPSIQMEFFYFKTQFVGFQFIDIDNQTPRVDQQNKKKMVIRIYIL